MGRREPGTQLVLIGEYGGIDATELQSRFDACQDTEKTRQDEILDDAFELLRDLVKK